MKNLKKIIYQEVIGQHAVQMVALFDERDLSEEDAKRIIDSEEYSKFLITMDEIQFNTVFRDIAETLEKQNNN